MDDSADDLCPRPPEPPRLSTIPQALPLFPASVYRCADPGQALAMLDGSPGGYFYRRDGHPNADLFAARFRQLHQADWAHPTASGMSALAAVVLSQLGQGDHLVAGRQSYGRSLQLLAAETRRFGIDCSLVDPCDASEVQAAVRPETRWVFAETLTNPMLRCCDIQQLAQIAHRRGARLLIDNTFASPLLCRPLELGADLVLESATKIVNGHSDVLLGVVCGRGEGEESLRNAISVWGLMSSPFDCWLASRGLMTLHLRVASSTQNALAVARHLEQHPAVSRVRYPGLESHPDHDVARRQLASGQGWMVTFDLPGGLDSVRAFLQAVPDIPFCPSLGEVGTTLSHPASTSHRGLEPAELARLEIGEGTLRLSVGTESLPHLIRLLDRGLAPIRATS